MAVTNLKKNREGYGYRYTELAEIHNYLESRGIYYRQYIEPIGDVDYIVTVPIVDGQEGAPIRGCRVVEAKLSGKVNPAQEYGAALTFCRRYSLLMAFGLATTDDDANCLTVDPMAEEQEELSLKKISQTHIKALNAMIDELHRDRDKMLEYYGVESIADLSEAQYGDAMNMLIEVKNKKK